MTISLSIIIPCYNEESLLPVCIASVLKQAHQLGPSGEVIISVNGSTDHTLEIANSFKHTTPIVKVVHIAEANKKLAMNLALDIASNRYVVFLDADSFLDENAISEIKKKLQKNKYAIIGAIRRPHVDPKKINVRFPETYFMLHYAKRLALTRRERLSVQGWMMAIDMNKFNDRLRFPLNGAADDIWLSAHTWITLGRERIGYIPYAIGTYIPPSTLIDMKKQLLRHRSNHKVVQNLHPELMPYFVARNNYYTSIGGGLRWKARARALGIDFNVWSPLYSRFLASLDTVVVSSGRTDTGSATWDSVVSTKSLVAR